jgi:multidrug efflux pump subunit AcrB
VRPILAEAQARRAGLDRPDVAKVLESGFEGYQTGIYREGEELLPIVARAPDVERKDLDSIRGLQIWSPAAQRMIPLTQVVTGFETVWEEAHVWRRDREPMIKIHADPFGELPAELFARVKPRIEAALGVDVEAITGKSVGPPDNPYEKLKAGTIPVVWGRKLPLKGEPGYYMAWGGQMEDSSQANAALSGSLPMFFGAMILIVIILFNSLRQPLVIFLTVPLALIGIAWGLLATGQPFGFKNAIVLVDEINANLAGGKSPYDSVVMSGVSRVRPVSMAALTTVLGMAPLLPDAFFVSMAVTIMAGLSVATVLTLIVVPVFYTIIFRIPSPAK